MRKLLLLGFLFFGFSPAGNLDRIRKAFEKLEFEKAYELIAKAYGKDPTNAGAIYYSALLHSTDSFDGYDLDTARVIVRSARNNFEKVDEETISDWAEDGVTIEKIEDLVIDIRDRIYARVDSTISVENAETFMELYPNSPYHEQLIFRRDSIVFEQVRRNDLLGVYEEFLDKYSTEEFREIAKERIDELRYQILTHSGGLDDYYQFLRKYPDTKFKDPIESYILKMSTVDHLPQSYIAFIELTQNRALKKKAADILYYLQGGFSNHPERDSLQEVESFFELKLLPAMDQGKFGFHSSTGGIQIPYSYTDIGYTYKCEVTTDDWLMVSIKNKNVIITKTGAVVIEDVDSYEDLSSGAALVATPKGTFVYHKSGFKILETSIQDASVLNGRWIRVKKDGKWALVSFSGRLITDFIYNDIRLEGHFWVFEKDQLLAVYNEELIEAGLTEKGLDLEFKFDDLELITDKMAIGFRDDRECMLNDQLEFQIPWGVYEINPDESGWYLKTGQGYRLYDHSEQDIMNQVHPYLETNAGWLALKTNEDWMLLPRSTEISPTRGYDSLKLLNEFCVFTLKEDDRSLLFSNGTEMKLDTEDVQTFFSHPGYLLITNEDIQSVVDSTGVKLISGLFEEVNFFNDTLVKVKVDKKNGLIKIDSTYLILPEYDAIDENEGLVLCLKEGLIGSYDLNNATLLSPDYEARIERIGQNYLVKKDGKFGVINSNEDPVISFSYDEIKYWNDSSYLVRQEQKWNIIDQSEELIDEPLESLTELVSTDEEIIWKYVRDGKYGLVSNLNGFLLTPEFTDIFNVGDMEDPVFFADQHLDKAGFHVVSYINRVGDLIFSKAYSKAEFEKILCDD